MEDIARELNALKDEIERLERKYDDLILNLDSDNIIEIDFGRTRIRNGEGSRAIATKAWVIENFMPKAGE